MAATTVLAGAVQPASSRNSLAASLAGDHEPLAAALLAARNAAENSTPGRERDWALDRLEQFHSDGRRLSDPEAARLLVAVKTTATRDALWEDMSRENTSSHIALWTDLTRRSPDEIRAAPAALLGFSSWLKGDGARAWCALDQVPADQPYPLAAIVASALQNGLHPREWERANATMREIAGELATSPTCPIAARGDQTDASTAPGCAAGCDRATAPTARPPAADLDRDPQWTATRLPTRPPAPANDGSPGSWFRRPPPTSRSTASTGYTPPAASRRQPTPASPTRPPRPPTVPMGLATPTRELGLPIEADGCRG